jgi:hypothetical protein
MDVYAGFQSFQIKKASMHPVHGSFSFLQGSEHFQ